jgi:hypothetical protein
MCMDAAQGVSSLRRRFGPLHPFDLLPQGVQGEVLAVDVDAQLLHRPQQSVVERLRHSQVKMLDIDVDAVLSTGHARGIRAVA